MMGPVGRLGAHPQSDLGAEGVCEHVWASAFSIIARYPGTTSPVLPAAEPGHIRREVGTDLGSLAACAP